MCQDFKLNSGPEMSGSRESWPRPSLALLLQSGMLGPERTFRKSSQGRRAPHSLCIRVGGKNGERKA